MINQFAAGIDLGTSTSEICIFSEGKPTAINDPNTRSPIIPSIAVINPKGQFVVGRDAESRADLPGQGVREVKRKMGTSETVELLGKNYRPEQISAQILRKLVDNAEEALGISISGIVLSVPANFDNAARQATLDAAEIADLRVIRLINEPTAAALAFGIRNMDAEEQLAVFDFGGGTLDITILEMITGLLDVKCSYGDSKLGGKDFDEELKNLVIKKFQIKYPEVHISEKSQLALKGKIKYAKENLSNVLSDTICIPNFAVQNGEPIDLDVEVTREEFEEAIEPLLERARECLRKSLETKDLKPSDINRVLLVGGTTYIPSVRRLVADFFGKEPAQNDVDPDLAVSIGASVQAAIQQGLIDPDSGIMMTDVSPFGLGILIGDREIYEKTGDLVLRYDSLIDPNTKIPYTVTKPYALLTAEQNIVAFQLYQDHIGNAQNPDDAIDTGIIGKIEDIPNADDDKPYGVDVDFLYNENGLVELKATIPKLGRSVEIQYERPAVFSANVMTPEEKIEAREESQQIELNNGKPDNYKRLLSKANTMLPSLREPEKNKLSETVAGLEDAIGSGNPSGIDASSLKLLEMLFEIKQGQVK